MKDRHEELKNLLNNVLTAMYNQGAFRSCLNCEHWKEDDEVCRVAGFKRPPAKIIAYGCDAHKDVTPFDGGLK